MEKSLDYPRVIRLLMNLGSDDWGRDIFHFTLHMSLGSLAEYSYY